MNKEPECLWNWWRFYKFDSLLESYYKEQEFQLSQFRYLFFNIYWRRLRKRINNFGRCETLPCEWCGEVRPTSHHEIWCETYPVSKIKRLCNSCAKGCAGA